MTKLMAGIVAVTLAGCGVETATTAASGAAIKQREIEDGKKSLTQVERSVGQSIEQMQQRAGADADK
jgi:TolA-binding protein